MHICKHVPALGNLLNVCFHSNGNQTTMHGMWQGRLGNRQENGWKTSEDNLVGIPWFSEDFHILGCKTNDLLRKLNFQDGIQSNSVRQNAQEVHGIIS